MTVVLNPAEISAAGGATQGLSEVWDSFALQPDGYPVQTQSGQDYILRGTHGSIGIVSGGYLTALTPNDRAATYTQIQMQKPGICIGASFVFGAKSANGGSATIGFWKLPMDNDTVTPVEDCPAHFVIKPDGWSFDVWSGGVGTTIASGSWLTELATDGATLYSAECVLDRDASAAYLRISAADGQVLLNRRVSNALIGSVPGNYAFIESFRTAANQSLAAFRTFWADSKVVSRPPAAVKDYNTPNPPAAVSYGYVGTPSAGNGQYTAPTGSNADVDATNLVVPFTPKGSKVMVEMSAFVKFFQNINYYWTVRVLTSTFGSIQIANGGEKSVIPSDGIRSAKILVEGLTPGQPVSLKWGHLGSVSSSAVLWASADQARKATMTVYDVN